MLKPALMFLVLALLSISVAEASSVYRTFSKTAVLPNENIVVNLTVSITAGETFYAIDESYPSGWTVVSTTGDTNQSGHIKWAVIQGAANANRSYTIRAPAQAGTYGFSGLYQLEGMAGEASVSGQTQVTVTAGDTTPPGITFYPPTPANNTVVQINYIYVNVLLSENPGSCTLNWNNGSWTNVSMSVSGLICYRNMTGLANRTYQFRVYATDAAGNLNVSVMRQNRVSYSPPDTTSPTIQITGPTSGPSYSTNQSSISISGTASDNAAVTQVTWTSNRGGSGTASGTTSWSVNGITLYIGGNVITVFARDAAGNAGTDALTVNYTQACIDKDGDGYGNPASPYCARPELDCNDSNQNVKPNATEICNGADDNCDGFIDTGCGVTNIIVATSYYDGSTTNFSSINLSAGDVAGMVLEKIAYGRIVFRDGVRFTQSVNLDSQSNISFNRAFINSTAFPMLNKPATIYLYNLTFVNPVIQIDGSACPSPICTKVSYSLGTLLFNVTGFSAYSAMEGPYCGDGSCTGETCSSCSQDCGACPPSQPPGGGGGDGGGDGGGGGGGYVPPVQNLTQNVTNQTAPPVQYRVCIPGGIRECSLYHKGICSAGTEACANDTWVGCPEPVNETYNGLDDDCDTTIDEGTVQADSSPQCPDGLIPLSGCRCEYKFFTRGYCYSDTYYEGSIDTGTIIFIFGLFVAFLIVIIKVSRRKVRS